MELDLDSLFIILEKLSYKDLYNFPLINKYYLSLNQNPFYISLLYRKRDILYQKARKIIYDKLFEILNTNTGVMIFYYITDKHKVSIARDVVGITCFDDFGDTSMIQHNQLHLLINRLFNYDTVLVITQWNIMGIEYFKKEIRFWLDVDPDIVMNKSEETFPNYIRIYPRAVINRLMEQMINNGE